MDDVIAEFARRARELNVDRSGGLRKPHKPLLLLYALARLVQHGETSIPYSRIERDLAGLLRSFAPPIKGNARPENPYWHLHSDGVWEIEDAATLERNQADFPTMAALRGSRGRIPDRFRAALESSPTTVARIVQELLDDHFEPSVHADVLSAVGFAEPDASAVDASRGLTLRDSPAFLQRETVERWRRPDAFARAVMAAYDFRCAVTGYRAELAGAPLALEAAHLQWHCKGGPATLANGLALQPTLHRLLDQGAWTLDDDRRVRVSSAYQESADLPGLLAPLHGKRIREPNRGAASLAIEHIRWHREPDQGGIFRG